MPTTTTSIAPTYSPTYLNPQLMLLVNKKGLEAESNSPAPLQATILRLPFKGVVRRMRLHSRVRSKLQLSKGRYLICVSQPATGKWRGTRSCTGRPLTVPALHHRRLR
jgi:hypothetical protein